MTVTATLVTRMSSQTTNADGTTPSISAEVDNRSDGLNLGKTSPFVPGSNVYVLVWLSGGATVASVDLSAGSIAYYSTVNVTRTETVAFTGSDEGTVDRDVDSIVSGVWLGHDLGAITATGKTIKAENSGVAILELTYVAKALTYRMVTPATVAGRKEFDILVLFTGQDPGA